MTCPRQTFLLALGTSLLLSAPTALHAGDADFESEVRKRSLAVQEKVIEWRRDIHEHPELGDQETRTSRLVAEHLRSLGLEVRTEVARTGVIGVLKGGKPGRTVALLEVMKTFNRIAYGGEGLPARAKVLAVVPTDESDVDEGDVLLLVEPA